MVSKPSDFRMHRIQYRISTREVQDQDLNDTAR